MCGVAPGVVETLNVEGSLLVLWDGLIDAPSWEVGYASCPPPGEVVSSTLEPGEIRGFDFGAPVPGIYRGFVRDGTAPASCNVYGACVEFF